MTIPIPHVVIAMLLPVLLGAGYAPKGAASAAIGGKTSFGTVGVASLGVAQIGTQELPAMEVLHLRFTVENLRDPSAWKMDLRDVRLALGERTIGSPTFINGDVHGFPVVTVRRSERRIVDLYFKLPDRLRIDRDAGIRVGWKLTTSLGAHDAQTELVRATVTDALTAGWGPRWWCDPDYPWPLFYRRPGPVVHRPPAGVRISRLPR